MSDIEMGYLICCGVASIFGCIGFVISVRLAFKRLDDHDWIHDIDEHLHTLERKFGRLWQESFMEDEETRIFRKDVKVTMEELGRMMKANREAAEALRERSTPKPD